MDWNTGNNPWAPGGRMASRAPWGQKAIEQACPPRWGWAKAGPYFTPKSDAQIRKEALIQLAVIAAVVAAPALVGAAGGAAAGSGAAAAGTALPATTMVEGATVIAAQVAPAAAGAAGGAGMAALLPFAVGGALSGLQGAAQQGSDALNRLLNRLAPAQRPRLSPGGAEGQAAGDESLQHPGMQLVERLAGQIGKSKVLELALRRAMGTGNVMGLAMQPSLMQVVREAVAGVREVNVWEGGLDSAIAIPKKNENWPIELLDTARKVDYLTEMEKDIVLEYNKARYMPSKYAEEVLLPYLNAIVMHNTGDSNREYIASTIEAIQFLEAQQPLGILHPSKGVSSAAQSHADDKAALIDALEGDEHIGSDGSTPKQRIDRFGDIVKNGMFEGFTENIFFGANSAEGQIRQLIIDHTVPDRGHRLGIFNPKVTRIGVGISENNKVFRFISVIDLVTNFTEKQ